MSCFNSSCFKYHFARTDRDDETKVIDLTSASEMLFKFIQRYCITLVECIRRCFLDNSGDKLLEFFRLISRVYYNQSEHAEPASQATPTLSVSVTQADGLLSKASPPSAASAIVDSTRRDITLRPDFG